MKLHVTCLVLLCGILTISGTASAAVEIQINNVDDDGEGLNSTDAALPGQAGNPGTNLGEQRLAVFEEAASIWESALTALGADIEIVIQATFQDRGFTPCTTNSAVLGAAGAIQIFANFPDSTGNGVWPNTWYSSALANELASFDLSPGPTDGQFEPDEGFLTPPFADEIIAFFNPNLGEEGCLDDVFWYLGFDHNPPDDDNDLLSTVLHEFGHGLGFQNFVDDASGAAAAGLADVYTAFQLDKIVGKQWNQMTKTERQFSAVNTGNVVWNGPNVVGAVPGTLENKTDFALTAGVNAVEILTFGTASFGPDPVNALAGSVVESLPADGCLALTNPGAIAGNVALIDRGSCAFTVKVKNAQVAGATGAIIVNIFGGAIGLGGSDDTITIPSVGISNSDGDLLKGDSTAVVGWQPAVPARKAGADTEDRALLYAPNPVQPGSSISHYDTEGRAGCCSGGFADLLMEPFDTGNFNTDDNLDLTDELLADLGWDGDLHCPVDASDDTEVSVGSCLTGVTNRTGPYSFSRGMSRLGIPYEESPPGNATGVDMNAGCSIQDMMDACSQQGSRKKLTSCVQQSVSYLQHVDAIDADEAKSIENCAKAGK